MCFAGEGQCLGSVLRFLKRIEQRERNRKGITGTNMERSARLLTAVLSVLLYCLPCAFSAPKAKNESAPPAMKRRFTPYVGLALSYDQTILPRTGNRNEVAESLVMDVRGGATWRFWRKGDMRIARYDFSSRYYDEVRERDAMNHRLTGIWRRTLDPDWGMRLTERLTYRSDTGGEEDENIRRFSTYTDNRFGVDLDRRIGDRWKTYFGVEHELREYVDGGYDDWNTVSPYAEIERRVQKRGRVSLRYESKYLNVEESESEWTRRILAGYVTPLPWKLRLDAGIGVLMLDGEGATDPAGRVTLSRNWRKLRLNLRWNRSASVSTTSSQVVRRDYLVFTPRWILTPKLQLIGRVVYVNQQSLDNDRTDTVTWRSGLTLRRKLNDWLAGDFTYTYVDQDADGRSGTSLSGGIIRMGLNARF